MKKRNKYIFFLLGIFFISIDIKALKLEGDYIQGGLVLGKLEKKAKVYLDKIAIPVSVNGNFIIGFKRKHKNQAMLRIVYNKNQIIEKKFIISKRKYVVQKINRLNKEKVTPSEKFFTRIKKEASLIRNAKNLGIEDTFYEKGFIKPAKGITTGVYGSQRILNGKPKRPHYGLDIANKKGTEVVATSNGIVTLAEQDLFFSGGTIIIAHGQGLTSS